MSAGWIGLVSLWVPETRIDDGGRHLPTCATVTPVAVMAEACREHARFGGFADPLGKLDDRLDQLLPVEQGGVVVVGARDLHDTRLPGRL
jgi:hypothetical protein